MVLKVAFNTVNTDKETVMKQTLKRSLPLVMALLMLAATLITPVLAGEDTAITENLFKVAAPGEPNSSGLTYAMDSSNEFYTSSPIAVDAGDVLYFGPCDPEQGYYMTIYSPEGRERDGRVVKSTVETHATLSDGYEILTYTVPENVGYVCMITPNVLARKTVVTKNAPFGEQDYKTYVANFDVDAGIPIHRNSVLRNMEALFIGDSISGGSYDVMAPTAGRAFAGRIAISTGLKITNKSAGGATLIKNPEKSWIVDQLNSQKGRQFDIIVVFGGVNDARRSIDVGEFVENEAALKDINTFYAGLQYLLLTAKNDHPNAEIFYVSCFPLPGHKVGNADDMAEYAAAAGDICTQYDINFIDLYNNTELVEKLQPHTVRYLPDLLHPTSEGYDLITPYIQAEIERTMGGTPMTQATETTTSDTTDGADVTDGGETTATTQATTAATTNFLDAAEKDKGCGSSTLGTVTALITLCGACVLTLKKKK